MMRLSLYYRIQGTESLRNELAKYDADEDTVILLCDPVLWVYDISGCSRGPVSETIIIKIKLLFLAHLKSLFPSEGKPDYAIGRIVDDLFGSPPWGIETFDKWWKIEKYANFEHFAEVQDTEVDYGYLEKLSRTGQDEIDTWVFSLIQKIKRKGEKSAR